MRIAVAAISLALLGSVSAQFGNFFGGGGFHFGGQQQQQTPPSQPPKREHPGWNVYQEVHCRAGYVCPGSLTCVPTPGDCPCPYPEDTKCVLSDDRPRDEGEGPPFVCVRGGCEQVDAFAKPI